jgi:hypothetical protein
MIKTNAKCHGARPSGARRPGAGRITSSGTRVRVSSDAVVSAYIRDIALPRAAAASAQTASAFPVPSSGPPRRIRSGFPSVVLTAKAQPATATGVARTTSRAARHCTTL